MIVLALISCSRAHLNKAVSIKKMKTIIKEEQGILKICKGKGEINQQSIQDF